MTSITLDFGEIRPPDAWEVEEDCKDFAKADDICLRDAFPSRVMFKLDDEDISPSGDVPLLEMAIEFARGLEQAHEFPRGCVITPVCEYELAVDGDLLHIYWFKWESEWSTGQEAFAGEFIVDKQAAIEAISSFIRRVFGHLRSTYEGISKNPAFHEFEKHSLQIMSSISK